LRRALRQYTTAAKSITPKQNNSPVTTKVTIKVVADSLKVAIGKFKTRFKYIYVYTLNYFQQRELPRICTEINFRTVPRGFVALQV